MKFNATATELVQLTKECIEELGSKYNLYIENIDCFIIIKNKDGKRCVLKNEDIYGKDCLGPDFQAQYPDITSTLTGMVRYLKKEGIK